MEKKLQELEKMYGRWPGKTLPPNFQEDILGSIYISENFNIADIGNLSKIASGVRPWGRFLEFAISDVQSVRNINQFDQLLPQPEYCARGSKILFNAPS